MQPNAPWQAPSLRPAGFPPSRSTCTRRACIPQLIAETAIASPDAVAVSSGSKELSYGELEVHANRLAGYLKDIGVTREVPVAICLGDAIDYTVAALAVWKAGGAYVPLDPAWSGDLREWLITDSQATVLITRGFASRARFLIDLDRDAPAIARENSAFYVPPIKRDRLACIVYEPGDSRPAGVELT